MSDEMKELAKKLNESEGLEPGNGIASVLYHQESLVHLDAMARLIREIVQPCLSITHVYRWFSWGHYSRVPSIALICEEGTDDVYGCLIAIQDGLGADDPDQFSVRERQGRVASELVPAAAKLIFSRK